MRFMLDENVPNSVSEMLVRLGHEVEWIRDYVPPGAVDPLVAIVAEELDVVLVSFDGDFQQIAPRVPHGHRARFRRLSRIWMRCTEPQAAQRLERAMPLIESEYALAAQRADTRMQIQVSNSFIRTDR